MLTREQAAESIANTDLALLRTARTRLGRIIGDLEGIERSAYTEAAREAARMAREQASKVRFEIPTGPIEDQARQKAALIIAWEIENAPRPGVLP